MPWCPKCGYEYKEGYTRCADCNVELVESLEKADKDEKENADAFLPDETAEGYENSEYENTVNKDMFLETEDYQDIISELKEAEKVSAKPFVKASDRAEEYKSSAFALLLVGTLGIVFLLLSYLKIIPIALAANISLIFYVVMGVMFVIFIVIGVKSFNASKMIAAKSKDEDDLTERIYAHFESGFTKESLDEAAFKSEAAPMSEEEKFFPRSAAIRGEITEAFGALDEAYLAQMTENIYSKIYER